MSYAALAQMEEHWIETPERTGSNPVGGTRKQLPQGWTWKHVASGVTAHGGPQMLLWRNGSVPGSYPVRCRFESYGKHMAITEVTYAGDGEWEMYASCCDFVNYYDPGFPVVSYHDSEEAALEAADHHNMKHASLA